jgi:site-specific recombinase
LATLSHALTVQRRCLMDDEGVLRRIDELAREEHELFEHQSHGRVTPADHERLRRLQIMLDQCWDLLRERRARREAGLDPRAAHLRDEATVEGYTG